MSEVRHQVFARKQEPRLEISAGLRLYFWLISRSLAAIRERAITDTGAKMAISTGKAARRNGGTRYDCKRSSHRRNPVKLARWAEMDRERKRKEKHATS